MQKFLKEEFKKSELKEFIYSDCSIKIYKSNNFSMRSPLNRKTRGETHLWMAFFPIYLLLIVKIMP